MPDPDPPVPGEDPFNLGGEAPGAALKKLITKSDIEKMIEHIKKLEGKELIPGKPIDISPGSAAWYVAYGT